MISKFKVFEANLKINKGLSAKYLNDIKKKEIDNSNQGEIGNVIDLSKKLIELQGGELKLSMMGSSIKWNDLDKKKRVEDLANYIIDKEYGDLLDALNIEMDIELISDIDEEVKQEMEEPEMPEFEYTDDPELRNLVDKRKLVNIVTQGSAKNIHRIIHIYKSDIDKISPDMLDIMDNLIKSQEKIEWKIPESDDNGKMIKQMMNGYSKVEYENEEDEEEIKDMEIDIDSIINGDSDSDIEEYKVDSGKIKVISRGLDLVILLHEAIKGIYEVLGLKSIPEDSETAENVIMNTDTLQDEFEDLKYGPMIRKDLLNFVNSNSKSSRIDYVFEYVWGAMVSMEAKDFLSLFFDILIIKGDKSAKWLDKLLDELISDEDEFNREMDEYNSNINDSEYDTDPSEELDSDYSKLSKSELNDLLNKALDKGDFEEVDKISKFI